jgi:hypothetical protein
MEGPDFEDAGPFSARTEYGVLRFTLPTGKAQAMKHLRWITWLLCSCALAPGNMRLYANNRQGPDVKEGAPVVTSAAVRITDRIAELRCEIRNDSQQDIWVFARGPGDYSPDQETNARVFAGKDDQSVVILRRMDTPLSHIMGERVVGEYVRLAPGQERAERLVVSRSVYSYMFFDGELLDLIRTGGKDFRQLTFEIGYYTAEDLRSMANLGAHQFVRVDKSGERVSMCDFVERGIWTRERAVRVTFAGVRVPWKNWLRGDGRHVPLSPGLVEVARPTFLPDPTVEPLPAVKPPGDANLCEDPPQVRHMHALEDLFYSFALSLEQYQYGRQLLALGALPEGQARQIADVYVQVAEGKLNPAELTPYLDKVLSKSEREKLLDDLLRKRGGALLPKGETGH